MADSVIYGHFAPASNPNFRTLTPLEQAAQAYMRVLQADIAAGKPNDELTHMHEAWASAGRQLLAICGKPTGQAPMVLR